MLRDGPAGHEGWRCRVCGERRAVRWHVVLERQLGLGGAFDYGECAGCGSMGIVVVPVDLARFYGEGYYSFKAEVKEEARRSSRAKRWFGRGRAWVTGEAGLARSERQLWLRLRLPPDARILDVGAGTGRWLEQLHGRGYRNLTGIDAFLDPHLERDEPVRLRRALLSEIGGEWDLIAYHHVMEHVSDIGAEMKEAVARLRPGGRLLVRVPWADSWACRHYGTDWLQWDAPRHLAVPTRRALDELAQRLGLHEEQRGDDSTAVQIWGSRGYREGCNGWTHRHAPGPSREFLPKLPRFLVMTAWVVCLNALGHGDQGYFVWRKPR